MKIYKYIEKTAVLHEFEALKEIPMGGGITCYEFINEEGSKDVVGFTGNARFSLTTGSGLNIYSKDIEGIMSYYTETLEKITVDLGKTQAHLRNLIFTH